MRAGMRSVLVLSLFASQILAIGATSIAVLSMTEAEMFFSQPYGPPYIQPVSQTLFCNHGVQTSSVISASASSLDNDTLIVSAGLSVVDAFASGMSGNLALGRVAVIVASEIYEDIQDVVSQYCADIEASGYSTILYHSPFYSCEELKARLKGWYSQDGIVGAVLIGPLPVAYFYHGPSESFSEETFPCDLYLMDMDGTWSDTDLDGVYDRHTASKQGDIYPEIFVGRIDPTCLSWGDGVVSHIRDYLTRLHEYRRGMVQREDRALMYVDDDWANYWGARWSNDLRGAFSNQTLVLSTSVTTATDWLQNRLPQNYRWAHICVHSSPTAHYFGPGGRGQGVATSAQIRVVPPAFSFYNLFACSAADWTQPDCLAVTYLFSGPYGLAVIGSTKTGSMMDCEYFYQPLGLNATVGESLLRWYCNSLATNSTAGEEYLEWYYGMCIQGDPLLTIVYDCTVLAPSVISMTHPDCSCWYNDACPVFMFMPPPDVNGIVGYYYLIDHNASTIPTPDTGIYTADTWVELSDGLDDGIWYLHVVARDSAGNIGQHATHLRFNIDTTAPILVLPGMSSVTNCSSDSIELSWSVIDSMSGHAKTRIWIDDTRNVVYDGDSLTTFLSGLAEGSHLVNVTVSDNAGNTASQQYVLQVDMTPPVVRVMRPPHWSSVSTIIELEWQVTDTVTGYRAAEIWLDDVLVDVVDKPVTRATLNVTGTGPHNIVVVCRDWVDHYASAGVTVFVWTPSLIIHLVVFSATAVCATALSVMIYHVAVRHRATSQHTSTI